MTDISLKILDSNQCDYAEIDTLFQSATNPTLFHHPKFLSYHDRDKFPHASWQHYLFREGNRPIGYLPGALVKNESGLTYKSPFASSFGGLVHGDLSFATIDNCLDLWWQDLQNHDIQQAEVVLAPLPYSAPHFCEGVEFKLNQLGFNLDTPELCPIVPISDHPEFPKQLFRDKAWRYLKQVRKSEIQVTYTQQLADIERFYPVLAESRNKHGVLPTHSLAELARLHELYPSAMHLFLATIAEEPIAGILSFQANDRVLNAFYQATNEEGQKLRVMNLLFAELYSWALTRSILWIDLGSSSFGLKAHTTLIHFKETYGGRKFLRRRYLWQPNRDSRGAA